MKVLADFHHHDLWESLELLLGDRLGFELYRPIGLEWFSEGYWNHERKWHGDAIARQYLEPWGSDVAGPDCGFRADASHPGRHHRLLTLAQARDLRPDIVLSTLAHNHEGFARFASEVGATFGLQIGNVRFGAADMAEDRWDLAAFGLVSGIMPVAPPKPHVVYHQEFDLRPLRERALPPREDPFVVSSFVQCYPQTEWAYTRMTAVAERAPDLRFKVYGAYGEAPLDEYAAGNLGVCADVARAINAADVIWHAKRWSDGYGHVIHSAFAAGRPVFGFAGYYANQLAGPLFVEGETSFDIEHRGPDEIAALLRRLRDDAELHHRMSEAARRRFDELVDFEADAEAVRGLFAQVLA